MSLKTISLTKKEIINAINTEPLGARQEFATTAPGKKTCKVCAVGAVIRFAGANRASLKNLMKLDRGAFESQCEDNAPSANYFHPWDGSEDSIRELQTNMGPLSALSSYYEALKSTKVRAPKIRTTLSTYVKNNFPARTKITVNV